VRAVPAGDTPSAGPPSAATRVVRFEIEDDGPGFAAEDMPHLFQPFYRGRAAAHDERRGVGLGLALVRRIAERHGGAVHAENRREGGARVILELPATPPPAGRADP
jgi:signal transduction histidine kinase